jgi:hypothetical protein
MKVDFINATASREGLEWPFPILLETKSYDYLFNLDSKSHTLASKPIWNVNKLLQQCADALNNITYAPRFNAPHLLYQLSSDIEPIWLLDPSFNTPFPNPPPCPNTPTVSSLCFHMADPGPSTAVTEKKLRVLIQLPSPGGPVPPALFIYLPSKLGL